MMSKKNNDPDDIEIDDIYGIIASMRKAKEKYCKDNGIEGSNFCADITVFQMDSAYETPLRRVEDSEHGYARWWKSND